MNQIVLSTKRRLIGVPSDAALKALQPTAPEIDINGVIFLMMPHDETATHCLRYHGHEAPAPILSYYEWPGSQTEVQHLESRTY